MKTRCINPKAINYPHYGGRGVKVCERWLHSFENFLADMGPAPSNKHTLDRFPNQEGDYEPGNCRWATHKTQNNNRRGNRLLTFQGKTQTVAQWADDIGINSSTLYHRLYRGMSVEMALTRGVGRWIQ